MNILRQVGWGILWVLRWILEFTGFCAEHAARMSWRFARWAGLTILEAIGAGAENSARGIWRWARQAMFGNWRRTLATSGIASLALVHYFPQKATPFVAPLWTIAFALLGIYIMFIPFLPKGKKKKKK